MRSTYREGQISGGSVGNRGAESFPPQEVLYVYLTWKISTNWQGHPSSVNKQFYIGTANPIGAGWDTYFNARGIDDGPLRIFVYEQGSPTGNNPIHAPNVGDATLNRGQWYELEFLFTANTPGIRDGRVEVWKDGVKVMDQRTFGVVDEGEGPGFKGFAWAPIWGGAQDITEAEMYLWLDHVYISGK
jgi:hypothetical protein